MVQTNKILTVSYGTFSCTLEGFDESFETMKAIAEYFRDLAQDDRYFGAEPPTPDAEMLARIAEKEISRRVEARFENDGIVLRPSLAAATEADTATAPSPEPAEVPEAPTQDAPLAAGAGPDVAEPASRMPTDTPVEHGQDGISQVDAGAISDDTETEAQDPLQETAAVAPTGCADDTPIADQDTPELEEAPVAMDMVNVAETTGSVEEVAPIAEVQEPPRTVQAEQPAPVTYAPGEDPAIKAASPAKVPESIAEKLARIRAVVASAATGRNAQTAPAGEEVVPPFENAVDTSAEESVGNEQADDTTVSNIMSTLASGDAEDDFETATAAEFADDHSTDQATETAGIAPLAELETEEEIVSELGADDALDTAALGGDLADEAASHGDYAAAPVEEISLDLPEQTAAQENEETAELAALDGIDTATDEMAADPLVMTDPKSAEAPVVQEHAQTEEPLAPQYDQATDLHAAEMTAPHSEWATEGQEDEAAEPQAMVTAELHETDVVGPHAETADLLDAGEAEMPGDEDAAPQAEADAPVAPRRVAPRRPVRVVKVKRRPAAIDDAPPAPQQDAHDASSLSVDDEADLMRELAEVEAELDTPTEAGSLSEDKAQDDFDVTDDTARTVRAMARRDRRDNFAEDEGDVSRLLAETDEQLQEPEGLSRRNAIAHLRAAVAATRADRGTKDADDGSEDPREAYRDDLAQAVRPRRNVSEPTTERPRAAPLKLVAEQRVDVEEGENALVAPQAVRPRRVSMPVERNEDAEAGGFVAYAEEIGAARLPELLEAAAAYMSFVEGRDQFSRPQLMTKVRQVERGDSSREDRLRSFGQLLRDGKIEKVEGGRFTVSDSIGFRPDNRAAG